MKDQASAIRGYWDVRATLEPEVKFNLPLPVFQKMLSYARASKGEISGFGKTRIRKKGNVKIITILDVKIFRQTVSSGYTDLSAEALTDHYVSLVTNKENPKHWNLWWHSHNDFNVFFSSIDTNTIADLSKRSELFSICINKNGEIIGRYDKLGELVSEATIEINYPVDIKIEKACKEEVKEKISYNLFQPLTKDILYDETKSDNIHTPGGDNTPETPVK